jgi:putative transcriptional regulator
MYEKKDKRYKSDIHRAVHRMMHGMAKVGAVDKATMRDFDERCLTKTETLAPKAIKQIRIDAGVSQAVFAAHLGVTTGLISKWETGDKKPSRMALKLLAVVKKKGLEAVA